MVIAAKILLLVFLRSKSRIGSTRVRKLRRLILIVLREEEGKACMLNMKWNLRFLPFQKRKRRNFLMIILE
jgi:hypothetical protein